MRQFAILIAAGGALIALGAARTAAQTTPGIPPAPPHPCPSAPVNRQLDFWVGRWDVAPWKAPAGTPPGAAGTNIVEANLQQCVLVENLARGKRQ